MRGSGYLVSCSLVKGFVPLAAVGRPFSGQLPAWPKSVFDDTKFTSFNVPSTVLCQHA
jgi:hypothetical protein